MKRHPREPSDWLDPAVGMWSSGLREFVTKAIEYINVAAGVKKVEDDVVQANLRLKTPPGASMGAGMLLGH